MTLGALPETGESLSVYVNDKKVKVPRFTSVNGVLKSNYYEIQDQDAVEILNYYTVFMKIFLLYGRWRIMPALRPIPTVGARR